MKLHTKFMLLVVVLLALVFAGCSAPQEPAVDTAPEDLETTDTSNQVDEEIDEIFENLELDDEDVEIGELI
ncbi:MAG: hypothetical protein LAT82_05375 [Nanoarchaeota archaeon]|nr:hypothetical protein [Nanoarchaeota archaeon]